MTLTDLINYYLNLIILQYKDKPKARATIELFVKTALIDMLPIQIQDGFDIDQAEGDQLDIIGKYAGVSRTGKTFTQQVTLNDDDFRTLIKLKIIKNNSGSSLADIQDLLDKYFSGFLFVFDFKTMRMGYFLSSDIASPELAQIFIVEGYLPVPMGVELSATIYYPVLDQFFGFRTYEREAYNATPFNTYFDYQLTWPWLSYSYAVGAPSAFESSMQTESGDRIVQENGDLLFI